MAQAGDGVQALAALARGAYPRAGVLPGPGPGVRTAAARRRTAAVQASSTPPGACEKRQRNWRPPRSTPPARPEPHGNEIGACYGLTKQGAQQRFRAARNQAQAVTAAATSKKAEPAA